MSNKGIGDLSFRETSWRVTISTEDDRNRSHQKNEIKNISKTNRYDWKFLQKNKMNTKICDIADEPSYPSSNLVALNLHNVGDKWIKIKLQRMLHQGMKAIFLNGPNPVSFCLFSSFSNTKLPLKLYAPVGFEFGSSE